MIRIRRHVNGAPTTSERTERGGVLLRRGFSVDSCRSSNFGASRTKALGKPSGALAAAMFAARIIRQGYRPMKKMEQLPPADVHHLMLVFVDAVTERAVVILEINGPLRVGMLHWA